MLDKREIIHTRNRYIAKEIIIPRSHTTIFLTPRGRKAFDKLTREERRFVAEDGTGGGGFDDIEGTITFDNDWKPVHTQWRKIRELLSKAEKRRVHPR